MGLAPKSREQLGQGDHSLLLVGAVGSLTMALLHGVTAI
jgi:hypothetical protein